MKENITLIGLPGSGKTTLGKLLAKKLGKTFVDFDDDIIEKQGGKSVSVILREYGEIGLNVLEERLGLGLDFKNTLFSASGSLPYSQKAMKHIGEISTIIYLQVPEEEIIARNKKMKVERIIGMENMTLEEIFKQRADLYMGHADIVFPYSGSDFDTITDILIQKIGEQ